MLGCQGVIDDPDNSFSNDPRRTPYDPEDPPPPEAPPCLVDCDPTEPERPAATSEFPRLSHRQWENTVTDLLHLTARPGLAAGFQDDPSGTTFFDNNAVVLQVNPNLWQDYQNAAETLSERVAADGAALARIRDGAGSEREVVEALITRTFRRPATDAEVNQYMMVHATGPEHYPDIAPNDAGLAMVIQAALQSPLFVYRVESGTPEDGVVHLDDYQLATRLSYMLWDSMPDDELFRAAAAGELTGDGLPAQAARMLDHELAREKFADFHTQVFDLEIFDNIRVEGASDSIGEMMRDETEHFLDYVTYEQDGSVREMLTANYSFINDELASIYGLSGSFGSDLSKQDLDPTQRAGLLTQPGFLASHKGEVAPILRGVFVNLHVICSALPDAPVFETPVFEGDTRRERVTSATTCGAGCHDLLINPVGFAFETFDDDGRFRTDDGGFPIDAEASFPFDEGTEYFDGPVELAESIASANDSHRCYVQNWLEFAYGRPIQSGDGPLVREVATASREEELSVKEIVIRLVDSEIFRTRAVQIEEAE